MQPCLFCGVEYQPGRSSKYCSVVCRKSAWRVTNREKNRLSNKLSAARHRAIDKLTQLPMPILNCVFCGNAFTQDKYHPEQKCCSTICNSKWYRRQPENKTSVLRWKRESYGRHKDTYAVYKARYSDQHRFSGNRLRTLVRDNYTCQNCGYLGPTETDDRSKDVVVHHKDFSGSTSKPNNRIENLQTLCRPCHIRLHTHLVR